LADAAKNEHASGRNITNKASGATLVNVRL